MGGDIDVELRHRLIEGGRQWGGFGVPMERSGVQSIFPSIRDAREPRNQVIVMMFRNGEH